MNSSTVPLLEVTRPTKELAIRDLIGYFLSVEPRVYIRDGLGRIDGEDAEATVSWRDVFNYSAGTYIQPNDLASYLEPKGNNQGEKTRLLIGTAVSQNGIPIATFSPHDDYRINVFAGCNSAPAITISKLGNKTAPTDKEITTYQAALYGIDQHVFGRKVKEAEKPALILDDDCMASVVTISSAIRIVRDIIGLERFAAIQVNVGVSTAHSLVMLVEEAKRLNIPLEINVGYLAWGLTEGIGAKKEHQNYLANVNEIDIFKPDYEVCTVGDMGDRARRVRSIEVPWDQQRKDDYSDRQTAKFITWVDGRGPNLRLAFAFGGLMTEGMRSASGGQDEKTTVIMARATRQTTAENNFVVLFSHLIKPLISYKERR